MSVLSTIACVRARARVCVCVCIDCAFHVSMWILTFFSVPCGALPASSVPTPCSQYRHPTSLHISSDLYCVGEEYVSVLYLSNGVEWHHSLISVVLLLLQSWRSWTQPRFLRRSPAVWTSAGAGWRQWTGTVFQPVTFCPSRVLPIWMTRGLSSSISISTLLSPRDWGCRRTIMWELRRSPPTPWGAALPHHLHSLGHPCLWKPPEEVSEKRRSCYNF